MSGGENAFRRVDAAELAPPDAAALFPGGPEGTAAYERAVEAASDLLIDRFVGGEEPYSGLDHEALRERFADEPTLPERGTDLDAALETVADAVLEDSVRVYDPACAAHLQCPPTVPALAAELLLSGTNQSMDSFDQAPAASVVEERVVADLADLFGYPDGADGVFTSGGTQSNFVGLLLARDRYCERAFDRDVRTDGLPPEADRLRVLCSDAAHFTTEQAAHHLGLGEEAVVTVATDRRRRLDLDALDATLEDLDARGLHPFALVGTAGTTDFGSFDPLAALADRADERGLWYHVDAAYGGACALSERLAPKLEGIDRADSVAVDFHKLFYQPISCGAFLLRDGSRYRLLDRNAAYLNPEADDDAGVPNLVGKSVQTTRRFDALKLLLSARTLGREGLAECVEYVCDLADAVAADVRDADALELCCPPALSTVVFRHVPDDDPDEAEIDATNRAIREDLLRAGEAVVARTEVDGVAALKFTLTNPRTTLTDLRNVLAAVERRGERIRSEENR